MEDRYTFHSVATRTTDGLVTDADAGTIGELHACFGPLPDDAASFNFYAEGKLNGVTFTGRGNCLSTRENYPEPGVSGFRCYLDLTDLPPDYVGGQLATNTIVRALTAPAGTPDPPGYVQQSIATVRLWKRRDASGATAYTKYCASCHDQVGARIPTRDALAEMSPARILRTLDFGLMMSIAYPMKRDEREAVAAFLGKGATMRRRPSALCAPDIGIMAGAAQASWTGWGPSQDNARYQTAERAGLGAADIPRLELKWAYGFAGDIIAFAAPTVVNGTLFVGSAGGAVQALDAKTGCLHWRLSGERPRAHGDDGGNRGRGQDAALQRPERRRLRRGCRERRARVGKRESKQHEATRLTGSFAVHDDVAFIPAASWEETRALDPAYPCCTFRGSVTAVRVSDGSVVWKTYLVDAPQMTGQTATGTPTFGPSGAGIWSTPTVDERRGLLYVTTGDNYSHPGTATSDAVVALEIATGRIAWAQQTTPNDVYNSSCGSRGANCPEDAGPDHDFGSSAMLVQHAERHGHPRRGPEIRRRVRVRSGQRRQTAVAGPRRQRRNQRRRPMGRRERRPQGVCGSLGRRALAERERRGTGRLRAARPQPRAAASRRSTLPTAIASGSRRARRARRRARAAAPPNRPR